ncbi:DNA polymerase epsilon subunit 2 [Nilaparvata lugens]|uniref:DNA polymerase epsilon subunit 2 n=2 Tax=Nilaparvata lugens TaxID=108931 RepID=UPI000B980BDB|nr:DNA polymerase epsilon subunit 2 [Nilaparvata lugens]
MKLLFKVDLFWREAVDYLVKQFENIDDRDKREAWIEKICDHIGRQNKVQPFLEFEDIKSAVDACCKHVQESSQPLVEVISAFDVPKFDFHIDLKKFFPTRSETHPLLAPPETCTKFYTERFLMLKQRTLRHHLFKSGQQFQVQPIEVLLSSSHKIKHVVILGMLTTMKDGRYQLEDPTGSIPINLTGVKYHTGFFTDNCFVLAEGNYKDEIFHVDSIGFPPTETAEMSRAVFGGGNIFGGLPETSLHNYESLKALESSNPDSMIIFLSEVWLDRKEVMERLNRLFEGYADVPPAVIVLMGNFLSTDMGPKHSLILKSHFKELANMIGNYESLVKSTKFVFVPGPTDSFLGNILPRPPISKTVTEYFLKKVPNSIFTTSPCRLRYCTQEIVLMREDIIIRLCRNSLHAPDISDIPQHFVKTIVSQAYLMPLPVTLSPVYWAHETALRLYPLPDLIVMADSFQPYTAKNTGCIVTNPSSFSNGNYAFKVYIPSSREVEDSQIPEET